MSEPVLTILIPNYRTPDLTRICLRLLRKHTDCSRIHVIAIDNNSGDASTEYLRSLDWIELIEREGIPGENGPESHARALDMAVERVTTPYFLSIHTDTFVRRNDWLDYLLSHIDGKDKVGGVGSWKLESKTALRRWAKKLEQKVQGGYYDAIGKDDHKIEGKGRNYLYLRSHCALYRTAPVKENNLVFDALDGDRACGQVIHKSLQDMGYEMIFLESEDLGKYMDHVNHATMVLNPELSSKKEARPKDIKRVQDALKAVNADQILADTSLDA